MSKIFWLFSLLVMGVLGCTQGPKNQSDFSTESSILRQDKPVLEGAKKLISTEETSVVSRFNLPPGFLRITLDSSSFGHYLRHLPLRPHGSKVRYFDGTTKPNRGVYDAVVDMEISSRDLQQCADAVMRLRGEFLFHQKRYQDIHFNFLSDGKPRYFLDKADGARSYKSFRKYMEWIFAFANTASLKQELHPVKWENLSVGDVFIQSGNPYGHAIIVVDVAQNPSSGEKIFLLAQSYMPAQETQILKNPKNPDSSPWYSANFEGKLVTPEWVFEKSDLRRFSK